jgi:hypothetical protein
MIRQLCRYARQGLYYVIAHQGAGAEPFRGPLPYTVTSPSTATATNLLVNASLNCTT